MDNWRKFWRLTRQERLVFLQAAMLIPLVSFGLRMLGWQRLMRYLSGLTRGKKQQQAPEQIEHICRLAYLTNAAAGRRLLQATCLERSVVLWWLLRRRGIDSRIVFGSRKEYAEFRAHAWVEYEGMVINDRPEVRDAFAVFEQPQEDASYQPPPADIRPEIDHKTSHEPSK